MRTAVGESEERFSKIRRILIMTLSLNWGISLLKLLYGSHIRSASMVADGFHSLSDGASNIVGLLGIWAASRPMDRDHPYGHKKFETLAASAIGGLLFLVCFNVIREGIERLVHPVTPNVDLSSFIVMGIAQGVNIFVYKYELRKGRILESDLLRSDAMHTRADILSSLCVILVLLGVYIGYPMLDVFGSFLVSVLIAYSGFGIVRESSRVLSDGAAIPVEDIEKTVLSIRGIRECHQIRSRGRKDDIHVDLHVLVDPEMHLRRVHGLSYAIENKIKRDFPGVSDVVVHIEPAREKKMDLRHSPKSDDPEV